MVSERDLIQWSMVIFLKGFYMNMWTVVVLFCTLTGIPTSFEHVRLIWMVVVSGRKHDIHRGRKKLREAEIVILFNEKK